MYVLRVKLVLQTIPNDASILARQMDELVRSIAPEHVKLVPQTCKYSKWCKSKQNIMQIMKITFSRRALSSLHWLPHKT